MSFRCWGFNRIVFITPPRHPHGSNRNGLPPPVSFGNCRKYWTGETIASGPSQAVLLLVDVVEDLGVGEVAVEGEVAGDLPLAHPVDQLAAQPGVVAERLADRLTDFFLAEQAELQRVVLARGADVVGEEVVLGDLVPLLGMVPIPSGVGTRSPRT